MGVASPPAAEAAGLFAIDGDVRDVRAHPGGHIHDSFFVSAGARRYVLQRMNTRVFPHPELVMENIFAVTAHLAKRGERTLAFVPAREGGSLARDQAGGCWRMSAFLGGTIMLETARDATDAERAAEAFGRFQRALADYAGPPLHVTLPGFHDTEARVAALDHAVASAPGALLERARDLLETITTRRAILAPFFGAARSRCEAIERIAHHDAKIANLLFDARSGEAVCVVDLDTVMPGLSLFDFGDLVRSMVSPAAEDEHDPSRVVAEPARFAAIAGGYLRAMGDRLLDGEIDLLAGSAEAMVFEQGVRFLTDHLEGDRYYRVACPGQNLDRARVQFALLRSLTEQGAEFRRMVRR